MTSTEATESVENAMKEISISDDKDVPKNDNEEEEAAHYEAIKETVEDEALHEEDAIYDDATPNRIIVGRNFPLSFYVDRARRVLRMETIVHIDGKGENIATACKLVESLKRQKVVVTEGIHTGMNTEPYFTAQGDARWGPPTAVISFKLSRGEFAEYIADYQQRKIVEIFENADEKSEGTLSFDKVEVLDLANKFHANSEQIEQGKEFLSKCQTEQCMDLPTFIKYASIMIHPLLKNQVFKQILADEFGLSVAGVTAHESIAIVPGAHNDDNDDDDGEQPDEHEEEEETEDVD